MRKSMSKYYRIIIALIFSIGFASIAKGQGAAEVLRYSLQYPGYDPVTMVMPGVAHATGFGAYQENPAVMALFDESFFSAGLSDRYVSEKSFYLGNASTFNINSLGISHAGLVYKVPTTRGSLVVGGGYSQTSGYNRAFSGFGFNEQTTLTDFYASLPLSSPLNEAAFNAYAILDVFDQDGDRIGSLSIFRALPPGETFRGINQSFEVTEEGVMGEYSAFMATELFKNFFVGASIGAITGNYSYERSFLESDKRGLYNAAFIDTDGDDQGDTDINRILSESFIRTSFTGFSARLGAAFQITPDINIGAGYQFRNVLHLDRETDVFITTTLDNGVIFEGDALTAIQYEITRPARLNFGFAATDLSGFTFSAMAERVDYSSAEIGFDGLDLSEAERNVNRFIESNFEEVINLRFGLAYKFSPGFTPRVGYGYYPSPLVDSQIPEDINTDRKFFSGGFTAQISERGELNVGVQYSTWDQLNTLYVTDIGTAEVVEEQVHRWNIMAGLTYFF